MTNTTYPATLKQLNFVHTLTSERDLNTNPELKERIRVAFLNGKVSSRQASEFINSLMATPRIPKPVYRGVEPRDARLKELLDVLTEVPNAKYALPAAGLRQALVGDWGQNDLIFLQVREYRKEKRFFRLSGAPGHFNRLRVNLTDALTLAKVIKADPLQHTQRYAKHYRVCGRCDAELTDEVSRAYSLGPTCRKAFGIMV